MTMTTMTAETPVTARDMNKALRELWHRPVRLAVNDVSLPGKTTEFLIKLPSAAAASGPHGNGLRWTWLEQYLTRHLRREVTVTRMRDIRRRDCGTDVEFLAAVGGVPDTDEMIREFRAECTAAHNFPVARLCSAALDSDLDARHRVMAILAGQPDPGGAR